MCLAIFIALDRPFPVTPKEKHETPFRVTEIRPNDEGVRKHFSKPYIYEILGKDGCACDFQYDPRMEGVELCAEECRLARANLFQLAAYLTRVLRAGGWLELYAGYCSELALPPTYRETITPEQLTLYEFDQSQRKFLKVQTATTHGAASKSL